MAEPRTPAAATWSWEFEADPALPHFKDHFPSAPLLPGVALLDLAVIPGIRRAVPSLGRLVGLRRVKFRRPVPPGARIRIEASPAGDEHSVAFQVFDGDRLCASGVMEFEAA